MSQATLIVDGETRLDADCSEWIRADAPPTFLADLIKPGAPREPYLIAAALALAESAKLNQPIRVVVETRNRNGWTMTVRHGDTAPIALPAH